MYRHTAGVRVSVSVRVRVHVRVRVCVHRHTAGERECVLCAADPLHDCGPPHEATAKPGQKHSQPNARQAAPRVWVCAWVTYGSVRSGRAKEAGLHADVMPTRPWPLVADPGLLPRALPHYPKGQGPMPRGEHQPGEPAPEHDVAHVRSVLTRAVPCRAVPTCGIHRRMCGCCGAASAAAGGGWLCG